MPVSPRTLRVRFWAGQPAGAPPGHFIGEDRRARTSRASAGSRACATRYRENRRYNNNEGPLRAGRDAGPGLMQRPGEAGGSRAVGSRARGGKQPRQRIGRVVLPDARVRASGTERQSESEPVWEVASYPNGPKPGGHGPTTANTPLTWWRRAPVGASRPRRWLGGCCECRPDRCSDKAGCRPGQTDHGERGKRSGRAVPLVAAGRARCPLMRPGHDGACVVVRAGESPAHGEGRQQGRSTNSHSGGRA